ncbi:MAG: hypothetical protein KDK36_16285 [Leptospiraceae bacterium]|nr:hypothetical protein [Leptospiraceae bacterium]
MIKLLIIIFSLLSIYTSPIPAQEIQKSTFMGSSLIHMPSTEDIGKGDLDFRFNHRFANAKSGLKDFFGLDGGANTQLSLDYGLTEKLSLGIARTSNFKTYEFRGKYRLTSQSTSFIPLNISFFGVAGQETSDQSYSYGPYISLPSTGNSIFDAQLKTELNEYELNDNDKRSYLASFLISRRFNDFFSLQVSPIFVHRNFVKSNLSNDRLGVDFSGRIKITKRIDFTFAAIFTPKRDYNGTNYSIEDLKSEYNLKNLTATEINTTYNKSSDLGTIYIRNVLLDKPVEYYYVPFSVGLDIETGGHVFQLFVTNSRTIAHTQLLRGADFDYNKKEWSLGFNIHRYFTLVEDEELK